MPAGSEGTECGQRNPQRLAITMYQERPPRRREAVLLFGRRRIPARLFGMVGDRTAAGSSLAQNDATRNGPGGGFGEDRIFCFGAGPFLELGHEFLLSAVAHGDGDIAQQSASFCALYGRSPELSVELFRSRGQRAIRERD